MLNNKIIFISGGTGSWGTELTKQILERFNPREIRIFSRNELNQWSMRRKFENNPKIKFIIGDIRDKDHLKISLNNVDFVFHLAALKHVPVCEENPNEAVLTNIVGTQNLINATLENNVEAFVDVSTDKAVDPLNLYGITKACGEKLVIAANLKSKKTKFVCVRGGNVLGTNGSVVPLFREQILKTNKVTITDPRMTRFFITLKDAITLLFEAVEQSVGGEIFVIKMSSVKISYLAKSMIEKLGNSNTKCNIIGIRAGEKIHEVLVSRYEGSNIIEKGDYYIILPSIKLDKIEAEYGNKVKKSIGEFSSNNAKTLTKQELLDMLSYGGWLQKDMSSDEILSKLSREDLERYYKKGSWL